MAMNVSGPRGGAIADINVTPMADVMIVLLVIFMVATPILAGAPVRLPRAAHPVEEKGERLEVVVRVEGTVAAGGLAFSGADALSEWISARRSAGASSVVIVHADRGVAYGHVARVLSACRRAGVEDVALAAERRAGP